MLIVPHDMNVLPARTETNLFSLFVGVRYGGDAELFERRR
jgi:hypothetical protein